MKSSSISNVFNTLSMTNEQGVSAVVQPKQSFNAVLSSQTENGSGNDAFVMDLVAESDSMGEVQQTYEKEKSESPYREITKVENSKENKVSTVEENKEELENKVKKLLCKELNITEEELTEILATLGITLDSLINGTGLNDLMISLTGAEDMTELLLNDTFSNLMKNLELLVQDFSQQLAMTPEEFKMALAQLEVSKENFVDDMVGNTDDENVVMTNMSQPTQSVEEISSQDGTQTEANNSQMKEKILEQNDSSASQQVTYRQVETTVNAVGEQVTQVVEQTFVDADDIMRQITEFTKVSVQQGQASIEMQLNPAHLGKVYLQVAAKEGMITAQLVAENESVKQALENQLSVLKENMNQQGLKVEAVEVTIASHEFEQNLENNQQSAQESTEQENKQTRRFLSADNLDELSGVMSEEEEIVAKIMLDNGNSMDVTA